MYTFNKHSTPAAGIPPHGVCTKRTHICLFSQPHAYLSVRLVNLNLALRCTQLKTSNLRSLLGSCRNKNKINKFEARARAAVSQALERGAQTSCPNLCVFLLFSVSIYPPPSPLCEEGSGERSSEPSLGRAESVVKSIRLYTVWWLWVQSDSCSLAALCTSYVILVWLEGCGGDYWVWSC